jgi:hypothetical protein
MVWGYNSANPSKGDGMSFTAKVKATNEFFQATTDFGIDGKSSRDAHSPLDPGRTYGGHHFPGSIVGTSQYVEYSEAETAVFPGTELEEVYGDIRLVPMRS